MKTMSALNIRNTIVFTRLVAGLLAGASLTLFAICVAKVFDIRFGAAVEPWISTLPLFALVIAILWNIVAIATMFRMKFYVYIFGDLAATFLLAILGSVGFYHDDGSYLDNDIWERYDNRNWIRTEISAASVLLASCVLQLILALLSWSLHKKDKEEPHEQCKVCGCDTRAIYTAQKYSPVLEQMEIGVIQNGMVGNRKSCGTSSTTSEEGATFMLEKQQTEEAMIMNEVMDLDM